MTPQTLINEVKPEWGKLLHDRALIPSSAFEVSSNWPDRTVTRFPPKWNRKVTTAILNWLRFASRRTDKHAVSELSGLAELSESHFSKLFKLSTGLTPHRFIGHERINRSKELLRDGKTKLVEIAVELGFANRRQADKSSRRAEGISVSGRA